IARSRRGEAKYQSDRHRYCLQSRAHGPDSHNSGADSAQLRPDGNSSRTDSAHRRPDDHKSRADNAQRRPTHSRPGADDTRDHETTGDPTVHSLEELRAFAAACLRLRAQAGITPCLRLPAQTRIAGIARTAGALTATSPLPGAVDNKAVQEVIVVLSFYNGDKGWVVAKS